MSDGIKGAIIGAVATLIVGAVTETITIITYNDQKKSLVETTEKATVEKLADIYENVTEDMAYDQAFKIVFEDSERSKEDKNELRAELENVKSELVEKQKYIDENQSDIDKQIEEQAKGFADSGDYLRALVELSGIINTNQRINLLIKEYTQKYEASVTNQVNFLITHDNLAGADKLVNDGLLYLPNSQVLKDMQQRINDRQAQKMLDVAPASQKGGNTYNEYSTKTTGGKSFLMGGQKYIDGMEFYTYNTVWAMYPLNSNYNTLKFTLGHIDGSKNDDGSTLRIFYYNREIEEYVLHEDIKLTSDMPPREISLDINGLDYIKFLFTRTSYDSRYGIGNPILQ